MPKPAIEQVRVVQIYRCEPRNLSQTSLAMVERTELESRFVADSGCSGPIVGSKFWLGGLVANLIVTEHL